MKLNLAPFIVCLIASSQAQNIVQASAQSDYRIATACFLKNSSDPKMLLGSGEDSYQATYAALQSAAQLGISFDFYQCSSQFYDSKVNQFFAACVMKHSMSPTVMMGAGSTPNDAKASALSPASAYGISWDFYECSVNTL